MLTSSPAVPAPQGGTLPLAFRRPAAGAVFTIAPDATWPAVEFETDGAGPHRWEWQLAWRDFAAEGSAETGDNRWDAAPAVAGLGGTLTVRATAGGRTSAVAVRLAGANPTPEAVAAYLAAAPDGAGFDAILRHESRFRQFRPDGEPVVSFDGGYGMCQLTDPPPTFEQAWHWQRNVDAGLALFAAKRRAARAYLAQQGRRFTDDQLRREAVCRWNGGRYHAWDAAAAAWARPAHILCDSQTGNIGWDLTDPANAGRSEAELRARDRAEYAAPRRPGARWRYLGVCYADRLLG